MIRIYAGLSYLLFLGVFVYTVGWLSDAVVPRGIDGHTGTAGVSIAVDIALLTLFALQHSVMARPAFKRRTRRFVPTAAERATYVLASSAVLALLLWQWRGLDHDLWNIGPTGWRAVVWAGFAAGWLIVLASTFMIGHFDLFGLAQAIKLDRYREPTFHRPGFYAWVRHPIMTGFLIAFWATPRMTVGHLLFAVGSTLYVLAAVRFEEHDLRDQLGQDYVEYAHEVPRFVPGGRPAVTFSPERR